MIEAIRRYDPHLKPLINQELRVSLLKRELDYTNDLLKGQKDEWEKHGCSIMSNEWTYKKYKSIINFLVNFFLRSMFIDYIDASSFIKSSEKAIFKLLDRFVE